MNKRKMLGEGDKGSMGFASREDHHSWLLSIPVAFALAYPSQARGIHRPRETCERSKRTKGKKNRRHQKIE